MSAVIFKEQDSFDNRGLRFNLDDHNNSGIYSHHLGTSSKMSVMKLIDSTIMKFRVAKEFSENNDKINSIDFSQDGTNLISSSSDDAIIIYDCEKGSIKKTLQSKKYGVGLIRHTHVANTAIHTSTKIDDTIRYLSLPDNKYLRYFVGHQKSVVTLCMSPIDDTFLSGSLDKTIRLWDLKSPNCSGIMQTQGRPVANFDPEGLIFAVGINSEFVKLYDLRCFDKGPFNAFKLNHNKDVNWTGLRFAPDGKQICITTDANSLITLDSFMGNQLHTFTTAQQPTIPDQQQATALTLNQSNASSLHQISCEASYSPDSRYLFSGTNDGSIYVWDTDKGTKVTLLKGDRNSPIRCVQFNPKFMMLASACTKMSFWIPSLD